MSEFEQKQRELAEMEALEARLRKELVRVEAPAGFAERVMARAAKEPVGVWSRITHVRDSGHGARRRWAMFAAAAAVLVCVVLGGVHVQQERKRAQAEAEFQAAVRVTDMALAHAQEQLRRAGLNLNVETNNEEERR